MDLREQHFSGQRHPWEVVRAEFLLDLVARHRPVAAPLHAADVGSGDGWLAERLLASFAPGSTMHCWDAHFSDDDLVAPSPERMQRSRRGPDHPVHLVTAFDVLEHVADAASFLREEIRPAIRPDGVLVVSVPAHQVLFTDHDRALGHHRRYDRALLLEHLDGDFDVVADGALFTTLLAPRAIASAVERVRGPRTVPDVASRWEHGTVVTAAVTAVLRADAAFGRWMAGRRRRPTGLSLWAVATPKLSS